MNNNFSLHQKSQTGNLDSTLMTREYKLDLMAWLKEIKSMNPKLTQKKIAKEIEYSTSSLKCYTPYISMLSLYRLPPNTHKRKQKNSKREQEPEILN